MLPAGGEVAKATALLHVVSPHQVELLLVAVPPNTLVTLRQNRIMGILGTLKEEIFWLVYKGVIKHIYSKFYANTLQIVKLSILM